MKCSTAYENPRASTLEEGILKKEIRFKLI